MERKRKKSPDEIAEIEELTRLMIDDLTVEQRELLESSSRAHVWLTDTVRTLSIVCLGSSALAALTIGYQALYTFQKELGIPFELPSGEKPALYAYVVLFFAIALAAANVFISSRQEASEKKVIRYIHGVDSQLSSKVRRKKKNVIHVTRLLSDMAILRHDELAHFEAKRRYRDARLNEELEWGQEKEKNSDPLSDAFNDYPFYTDDDHPEAYQDRRD